MPSVLSDHDKEIVKRTIPKSANKIQAVAVARLYVAYPNKQKWVYTGLQGAAVLANDLVGNTYWIKMVDISVRFSIGPISIHTDQSSGLQSRRDMGPRDLRPVLLQPRPDVFPLIRARRLPCRSIFRGRKRSETIQEED